MHGAAVALLQVVPHIAAQPGGQADALQPVAAGGVIEPFVQTFCMNLYEARLALLNLVAMQVQQLVAQQGAVGLGCGGDECHGCVSGIEMIHTYRAPPAGRNTLPGGECSFFFQGRYCGIRADQAQPQRCSYLRAGCLPVLLHVSRDSGLGIHSLIRPLKKV